MRIIATAFFCILAGTASAQRIVTTCVTGTSGVTFCHTGPAAEPNPCSGWERANNCSPVGRRNQWCDPELVARLKDRCGHIPVR